MPSMGLFGAWELYQEGRRRRAVGAGAARGVTKPPLRRGRRGRRR